MSTTYERFIHEKSQQGRMDGFEPVFMPDWLFDFQRALVEWSILKGRFAIFADCGLGKTPMQLVWAQNVVQHTNRPVLLLTPLAVGSQTVREGEKFGIECKQSRDGKHDGGIVVTNYERLHYFDPSDFAGVVCDESSILKNFGGATRQAITEFMREMPYRLLCTATAAPNDYTELGTSSEAIGCLGYSDMITRFFKEESIKDYLGWGRKVYKFRGHAETPFWQWMCSWARACRRPSDLGFDDSGMLLPELIEAEVVIEDSTPRSGMLFSTPARDLREQREERRITIQERCETAAHIVTNHDDGPSVVWCHLNDEGDELERQIEGSVQVHGSLADDEKEERLLAFSAGQIDTLITKPKIGCFGLNWQHCNNVVTFASHSYEQYYQLVRRCYRFGQTKPVKVTTVATEGERGITENLQRKSRQAEEMFASLVRHMNEAIAIDDQWKFEKQEQIPTWL